VVAPHISAHFKSLASLLQGLTQNFSCLFGRLVSNYELTQQTLKRPRSVLVASNLRKALLNGFEDLFELDFASLLEKHLAEEIGNWVHHEFFEGCIFKEQFLENVFHKLARGA